MNELIKEHIKVFWPVAVAVIFVLLAWVVRSSFESAAYNRMTGARTTTWDAMWLELRVQEQPK